MFALAACNSGNTGGDENGGTGSGDGSTGTGAGVSSTAASTATGASSTTAGREPTETTNTTGTEAASGRGTSTSEVGGTESSGGGATEIGVDCVPVPGTVISESDLSSERPSLALDSDGGVHVAFYRTSTEDGPELHYGTRENDAWTTVVLAEPSSVLEPTIEIDGAGRGGAGRETYTSSLETN